MQGNSNKQVVIPVMAYDTWHCDLWLEWARLHPIVFLVHFSNSIHEKVNSYALEFPEQMNRYAPEFPEQVNSYALEFPEKVNSYALEFLASFPGSLFL